MTRVCRACGVSAVGTSNILKVFSADNSYKFGISTICKRCDKATSNTKKIAGEFCLLTERPTPLKVCECCGKSANTADELSTMFRQYRHVNSQPSSFTPICKSCETIACMVLSEFTYIIREGGEITAGSKEYYSLLVRLYKALGYTRIPTENGNPVDVLKFPLRYTLPDGRPFVKSAKRIWQIKIEAGYLIPKEDDFE